MPYVCQDWEGAGSLHSVPSYYSFQGREVLAIFGDRSGSISKHRPLKEFSSLTQQYFLRSHLPTDFPALISKISSFLGNEIGLQPRTENSYYWEKHQFLHVFASEETTLYRTASPSPSFKHSSTWKKPLCF